MTCGPMASEQHLNRVNLDLGAPFGGMKDSGLGPEALNNYLEYKSIYASASQL